MHNVYNSGICLRQCSAVASAWCILEGLTGQGSRLVSSYNGVLQFPSERSNAMRQQSTTRTACSVASSIYRYMDDQGRCVQRTPTLGACRGTNGKHLLSKAAHLAKCTHPLPACLSACCRVSAYATRSDVIMATGRSDFPNQVNNVLAFPPMFRGALDCRAK